VGRLGGREHRRAPAPGPPPGRALGGNGSRLDPSGIKENEDPALVLQDWTAVRSTMWNYVGIVRTRERLERAQAETMDLGKRISRFYRETRLTRNILELFQGILSAQIIASAALRNPHSVGCHYLKNSA